MQQPAQIFNLLLGNVSPIQSDVIPKGIVDVESDGLAFDNLLLDLVNDGEKTDQLESSLLVDVATEEAGLENKIIGSTLIEANSEAAVTEEPSKASPGPFSLLDTPVKLMSGSSQLELPEQVAANSRPAFKLFPESKLTVPVKEAQSLPVDLVSDNNRAIAMNPIDDRVGRMPAVSASEKPIADNVAEFNNRLYSELQLDSPLPKSSLNNLTYREAIDIEPGKYEVLSQTIENSTITLSVKNPQSKDAPIKLSLPVELFEAEMVIPTDRVAKRTVLDSGLNRGLQLQTLFDKLNLKEIEVRPLVNSAGGSSEKIIAEPEGKILDIKLIAQDSEKIMPVLRPVTPKELKVSRGRARSEAAGGKEKSERILPLDSNQRINLRARPVAKSGVSEKVAGLTVRPAIQQQLIEAFSQIVKGDTVLEQQRSSFDPIVVDRTQADVLVNELKSESRPVQMVLPKNLKTMLKPNGNSVTIKIEPEHLGPARISLSMQNNVLKARIMVDTVHIRSVVEASVDHLIDQLSKADIKVDQIEVSLSGNSFKDDFGGRRNFHRSSKSGQLPPNKIAALEMTAPASPAHISATQYVGSQGVNILA